MLRTWSTDSRAIQALRSQSGRRSWLRGAYSTRPSVGTSNDARASARRDEHRLPPTSENVSTAETGRDPVQDVPTTPAPIDVEAVRGRFREWSILTSSSLRQHVDQFSRKATTTFSHLGLYLNQVTGYGEIEALKRRVVEQETQIKTMRRAARDAKTAYDDAVLQRSISQRQVNDLLQRKSGWTDTDVSTFTSLVRSDHSFEQEESRAKARVIETEDAVDREFSELMRVILARYHEEQIWSDKIRSASTYGSLAVLGVNLVVFVVAIIVVEPWKRKKLAQTFEKKVEEMGAETKALLGANAARLEERLTGHEELLTELVTRVPLETRQGSSATLKDLSPDGIPVALPPPLSWWSQVYFSYPHLGDFRGRELTLIAGSAAVGGVITLATHSLFAR